MNIGLGARTSHPPLATSENEPTFRIAIVGCGPRGMYCLERLASTIRSGDMPKSVAIDLYEPSPFPGAGNVYDPRQPHHLRMNFANQFIDARHPGKRQHHEPGAMESFVDWAKSNRPDHADPDGYAPRAIVGEYLHDCYLKCVSMIRGSVQLTLHPNTADDLAPVNGRWEITTAETTESYNHIIVTVGHEGWRTSDSFRSGEPMADVPTIFPTDERLAMEAVAKDSIVAVRGFGLTWIDAALSLTEGRGGRFIPQDGSLRYEPSGNEPRAMIPFSRSGRPMLAKPTRTYEQELGPVWKTCGSQLSELATQQQEIDFRSAVWPVILQAADKVVVAITPNGKAPDSAGVFRSWCRWKQCGQTVVDTLRHSLATAIGKQAPDELWALGEAWRKLYPTLVDLVSHGGLTPEGRIEFQSIATEMERIAFGTPAQNVARLLALYDCGLIDFDWLAGCEVSRNDRGVVCLNDGVESRSADVLINATIPGPHQTKSGGIIDRLHTHLRLTSPLEVGRNGTLLLPDQTTATGLTVFGRAAEHSVLGNDTLSRTLHPEMDAWLVDLKTSLSRNATP